MNKTMSFVADEDVILKYNKIWKKIKMILSVKFDRQPVYDDKYITTRVKTFEDKVITKFIDNEIPKENTHYLCIDVICVDSVIKLEKENFPRINLEQCKFGLKKKKDIDLFDVTLKDSSDESEIETE